MVNPEQLNFFEWFFRNASSKLDLAALKRDWLLLSPNYDINKWLLPLPPWAQRPYKDTGEQAWNKLCQNFAIASNNSKPFCIYLHVPFCSSKCGFCDSYSFKLGGHQAQHIETYVERLCYELSLWSNQGNLRERPISTVHLGGGTPTFLGEKGLVRLVECCKELFNISPDTEWALESTVESLTPGVITEMHRLGFRRLHIGVQSLEEPVRLEIGRRNTPDEVVKKIQDTLALGWVVTVDLVCGLPYQTLEGFITGLETLLEAGVDGVSLYELLIYPQNSRWAEKNELSKQNHLPNFLMFLAGVQILEMRGFSKNLFNHWATCRDKNIYFTFPTRDEDLLAVGTIADGVFGDYHYRHPRYAPYLRDAREGLPGLEGGLKRNFIESRLQPFRVALLSGKLQPALVEELAILHKTELIKQWLEHGLVKWLEDSSLELTGSGSWFTGNLLAQLSQ
ncbi:MAG: radical SAM protein [Chloroflexi bacterium]|uniref:Radical SAM protein n=1 Tax=Candidatus Chlorohelix allophototropha TaxID=3003348 RepID=A0A8T7MAG5_9CHLR|nr:radical SAM protein [Chloroflexota bacterium]WJW70288.1 radical SAM protein [Chloroflexota bacterium L227-S17]